MTEKKKKTPAKTSPRRPAEINSIKTRVPPIQKGLGIIEDVQNQQTNITDYYANYFATK